MASAAREQLNRALTKHLNTIYESLQILDRSEPLLLEKVTWKEVIQAGEQVSKYATTVGMLCTGATPELKVLEENMSTFFDRLQALIFFSQGSAIGVGPTLSSCIHTSVKQVVDSSFKLLREAVSAYGSPKQARKQLIPQLVGIVSDACSALKKTPSTNVMAIGLEMEQVAVSIKDVLREMKELKPAPSDHIEKIADGVCEKVDNKSDDSDVPLDEDLGNDLSPEEMIIVQLTTSVVSEAHAVIKELVRFVTSLLRQESSDGCAVSVDSLEKLLKLCRGIGREVDELGACLYPPQEIPAIKVSLGEISRSTTDIEAEVGKMGGSSEDCTNACSGLRSFIGKLESELGG